MPSLYQSIKAQKSGKQLFDVPNATVSFRPRGSPQQKDPPGGVSTPKKPTSLGRAIADQERKGSSGVAATPPTRASTSAATPPSRTSVATTVAARPNFVESAKKTATDLSRDGGVGRRASDEPALAPMPSPPPVQRSTTTALGRTPASPGPAAVSRAATMKAPARGDPALRTRPGDEDPAPRGQGSRKSAGPKMHVQWGQATSKEPKESEAATQQALTQQAQQALQRPSQSQPIKWVDSREAQAAAKRRQTSPVSQFFKQQDRDQARDQAREEAAGQSRSQSVQPQRGPLSRSQSVQPQRAGRSDSVQPRASRAESPGPRPSRVATSMQPRASRAESPGPRSSRVEASPQRGLSRYGSLVQPQRTRTMTELQPQRTATELDSAGPPRQSLAAPQQDPEPANAGPGWRHSMVAPSAPYVGGLDCASTPRKFKDRGGPEGQVWVGGAFEKKLHGHFEGYLDEDHGAQKRAHDEELALAHGDGPRTRSLTPRPRSMRAAFTDRSMRIRDQKQGSWVPGGLEQADSARGADGKDCDSDAYMDPYSMVPAGCSTNAINSRTQFLDRPHWDTEGNVKVRSLIREQGMTRAMADSHAGDSVYKAIHCRDDEIHSRPEVQQERELLDRSIGRKGKCGMGPSSMMRATSVDGAAGAFNTRSNDVIGFVKMKPDKFQAHTDHRTDMAMSISPNRADDPPAPVKISGSQKAFVDGTPSAECEKMSVKQNNHLHRFEMSNDTGFNLGRRARSVSREHHGRNPVTHEGCWEKERSCTPRRQGRSNRSGNMDQLTNHEQLNQDSAAERNLRMQADAKFAGLCNHTQEHKARREQELREITGKNHSMRSSNLAESLRWE